MATSLGMTKDTLRILLFTVLQRKVGSFLLLYRLLRHEVVLGSLRGNLAE